MRQYNVGICRSKETWGNIDSVNTNISIFSHSLDGVEPGPEVGLEPHDERDEGAGLEDVGQGQASHGGTDWSLGQDGEEPGEDDGDQSDQVHAEDEPAVGVAEHRESWHVNARVVIEPGGNQEQMKVARLIYFLFLERSPLESL